MGFPHIFQYLSFSIIACQIVAESLVLSSKWIEPYYYVRNLQGDVIAILDSNGTSMVKYTYNAWGMLISTIGTMATTLGVHNPLRYRGYVYDSETQLYYLQSRYYDPQLGRFINADAFASTGNSPLDCNMFAYCGNNPVMGYDPTGAVDWGTFAEGAGLVSVGLTALVVATAVVSGGACVPLLIAAGATFAAGGMTLVNGVAEVVESTTGYNYMRDGVYKGDEGFYEGQKAIFETAAEVGTMAISAASTSPQVCFVAGTVILTANGAKNIETVQTGDYVWAWDEETGDVALKKVVETYINETFELIHVFVDDQEIIATPSHPFYSPVRGWTDAVHLRAGDILVLVNGEYVVVEKVQHEILEAPVTVYNFQVEDYHTYYVTCSGVLVHNDCPQRLVAGKKDGWNARVSDGGLQDHAPPHAHIYYKEDKLASVDANGNVLKGLKKLGRKGLAFVQDNLDQIAEGIRRWWG